MMTTATELSWDALAAREPRLAALRRQVEAIRDDGSTPFCANYHWYRQRGVKGRLSRLVGWDSTSRDLALHTRGAYDTGYRTLYDLLPVCRHHGPCWA